jgi:hypothetical protein
LIDKEQISAIWEELRRLNELDHSKQDPVSEVEEQPSGEDDRVPDILDRLIVLENNMAVNAEERVTSLENKQA